MTHAKRLIRRASRSTRAVEVRQRTEFVQSLPPDQALLMFDYENFHMGGTNGWRNVLYADGHVHPL